MKFYSIAILQCVVILCVLCCSKPHDPADDLPNESGESRITQFRFKADHNDLLNTDATGEIEEGSKSITVTMPPMTDVTGLVADFTISGKATAKIQETIQLSGLTANDFSAPVVYTITAQDGTQSHYTVTVVVPLSQEAFIKRFTLLQAENPGIQRDLKGYITKNDTGIHFRNPYEQLTVFIPSLEVSPGATVLVDGDTLGSGQAVDFSVPQRFRVQAAGGNANEYIVSMTPQIISFEDFIKECPQNDPNIGRILADFEIRVDGRKITAFGCDEPYFPMDEERYTDAVKWLQTLRILYYLDLKKQVALPWTHLRLYDWVKSKIDGINIVTGLNGGSCCFVDGRKNLVNVGLLKGNTSGNAASIPDLFAAWAMNNFSLLLHEARHMDGYPHSDCCPAGTGRCDAAYDPTNPSPYGLHVWWNRAILDGTFSFGFNCLPEGVSRNIFESASITVTNQVANFCSPFEALPQAPKQFECIYK